MPKRDTSASPMRVLGIAAAVYAVLQVGLAPQVSVMGGTFNFMVAFALVIGPGLGAHRGVIVAFLCGLFYDLTSPVPVGLMALILSISVFWLSSSALVNQRGLSVQTIRALLIVTVAVNMVYGLVLFFLGVETSLFAALLGHGLGSTVLDVLAGLPLLSLGSSAEPHQGFTVGGGGMRFKKTRGLK